MMVKQVKVSNFTEVKIVCENEHDLNSVVNALKQ